VGTEEAVPEEEVVKYKRQRYSDWGTDQQGQAIPLSSSAVVVFKDRIEAMRMAAHASLEAKKAEDQHTLETKQAEDKHLLDAKKAEDKHTLEAKQEEDRRMEDVVRAALKAKQDEDHHILEARRSLLKIRADEDDHTYNTLERLHKQSMSHTKERMAAALPEDPTLTTSVLKEYLKMQTHFIFKNEAEKKAILASAGVIAAGKYRAKWGRNPEQRAEPPYGSVNYYPTAESVMLVDSLRDASRKVRGNGLQPPLCFI
jgi:hypothetical protein